MRPLLPAMLLLLAAPALDRSALAQMGPGGPPPLVGFVEARRQPMTETTEFIGRIEAIERVEIRARVTGFLEERLFTEGSEVREGALLFRIERAPFEAQMAQARANLASAEAQLNNARVVLNRARELRQTGAGTQAALDAAQAGERTAAAAVLGAQAQVRVAEISLNYTEIHAPVAGAIGRASYTPGNVVSPGTAEPLATLVSQDPMRVAFTIPQRTAIELRDRFEGRGGAAALQVRVRLVNGQVHAHPGRVDFIDTQVGRDTDSILLRATIPNPVREGAREGRPGSRGLIDNQLVAVLLEGAEPVSAIVVPRTAIAQDQGGAFVFVVGEGNVAARRNVRLGRSTAATAVIEGGIAEGDRVITEGLQRVRPGAPVNPQAAGAPAAPGAPPGRPG